MTRARKELINLEETPYYHRIVTVFPVVCAEHFCAEKTGIPASPVSIVENG